MAITRHLQSHHSNFLLKIMNLMAVTNKIQVVSLFVSLHFNREAKVDDKKSEKFSSSFEDQTC
jgi:hypothetical protein